MILSAPKIFRILLALILMSQIALTVHVATHVSTDNTNCELCSGYQGFGQALSAASPVVVPIISRIAYSSTSQIVPPGITLFSYQQRAPPVLIFS